MVNSLENVYNSLNEVYMAALMAAPMVAISLAVMGHMYPSFASFWALIRTQGAVRDEQFLRSMIPHHAGAILMCRKAPIADAEIRTLCGQIIESQQREIDQMKRILDRLQR